MTLENMIATAEDADFIWCRIWDNNEPVYDGELDKVPDEYRKRKVISWSVCYYGLRIDLF